MTHCAAAPPPTPPGWHALPPLFRGRRRASLHWINGTEAEAASPTTSQANPTHWKAAAVPHDSSNALSRADADWCLGTRRSNDREQEGRAVTAERRGRERCRRSADRAELASQYTGMAATRQCKMILDQQQVNGTTQRRVARWSPAGCRNALPWLCARAELIGPF
jgi:hypothetical protein